MLKLSVVLISLSTGSALAETMPESLVGGWGFSEAACAGGSGAEGFLEITPTEIRFYESTGTLTGIEETEEAGIIATFSFSGEGDTWVEAMYLEAIDAGETLMRVDVLDTSSIPIAYLACR